MATPTLLNIDSNAKTIKGQKQGYMTAILYLAPFNASGFQVCPMAELAGCVAGCLNTAGRGGMSKGNASYSTGFATLPDNTVQRCRIARTQFYGNDRATFLLQLQGEIAKFIIRAGRKGLVPVIRLNGTSDIRWENERIDGRTLFDLFPDVQFYDYTKISNRKVSGIANYSLSYSYSGAAAYQPHIDKALAQGLNLVAVFAGKLPETFLGLPVVNGDESDLRFLDPANVVVGLKAKGRAKSDKSGFVVRAAA